MLTNQTRPVKSSFISVLMPLEFGSNGGGGRGRSRERRQQRARLQLPAEHAYVVSDQREERGTVQAEGC